MAFLDNSGDIILDAVLTDTGRFRLAKGDGSFKIVKFALGDDEINYGSYNKNHSSGSAYYDLDILQTPVLEAFTNNTSTMKSKLISLPRTNLLYLPMVKLNDKAVTNQRENGVTSGSMFVVAVDDSTETLLNPSTQGVIAGEQPNKGTNHIRLDQGLDTEEISPKFTLDTDLVETQFIVELDNRLGKLVATDGTAARVSFIDDDNIATYFLTDSDTAFVANNTNTDVDSNTQIIRGPRGTVLSFKVAASVELNTSHFLFKQLGSTLDSTHINTSSGGSAGDCRFLDANVRITGATTGYSVDVPVRFVKKI